MSVKKATLIYLAVIAILIVIVVIGRAALPSEYFGKHGLLTARYAFTVKILTLYLYITPLLMLAMYLVKAGEQITLKKAIVILVVSEVTLFWGLPAALSLVPQEYVLFALKKLASFGLKPAYYNRIGYTLGVSMGIILGLVPIGIFFIALMGAGKDTKAPNSQGVFDLRIKAGLRWFCIAFPGAFSLSLAYGPFTISTDSNLVIFLGVCALITMFIWHAISMAVLRLRYDG